MSTLGEYTEYDEWLKMLAEAQRYKLRLNVKKGFLGDVPPARLLDLLKEEIKELEDAQQRGSKLEMILEAADVANFALGFVIAAMRGIEEMYRPPMQKRCLMQCPGCKVIYDRENQTKVTNDCPLVPCVNYEAMPFKGD